MAYALVGSAGAQVNGVATPAAPAYGQSPTANNLLILWATSNGSTAPAFTTPAGWTAGPAPLTGVLRSAIFYKVAAGGDAAPSLAFTGGGTCYCQLAEFSGGATSTPLDQSASAITSPTATAACASADAAAGELVIYQDTATFSGTNAGNVIIPSQSSNFTMTNLRSGTLSGKSWQAIWGWAATTGNAVVDSVSGQASPGAGTVVGNSALIASFKLAAGAGATSRPPRSSVVAQAVNRSVTWMKRHSGIVVPRLWTPEVA